MARGSQADGGGTRAGARAGVSVDVDGHVIAVGAYRDDERGKATGAVHLYRWTGTEVVSHTKLTASDAGAEDRFGYPVVVKDAMVLVGAGLGDGKTSDSGALYTFGQGLSGWTQQSKLTAADGEKGDDFGWSAAVSGSTAVVGAHLHNARGRHSGTAYVFTRRGTEWAALARLIGNDTGRTDRFGWSVDVEGDLVVVGAFLDDDGGPQSGSVYVFERIGR